ncbi:MAG: antitoxin [Thermodesulfovibrio sp.]|nr:antitoxin [Thermodesulfovibrio sp.]
MSSKLTLRMDEELIRRAKQYSSETGKSVSRIVGDYFSLIGRDHADYSKENTPVVRSLRGALKNAKVSEKDYWSYIEKKHS